VYVRALAHEGTRGVSGRSFLLSLLSPSRYLFTRASVRALSATGNERIPGRSMKLIVGRFGAERLMMSSCSLMPSVCVRKQSRLPCEYHSHGAQNSTVPSMLSMMRLTSARTSASDAIEIVRPFHVISVVAAAPGGRVVSSNCRRKQRGERRPGEMRARGAPRADRQVLMPPSRLCAHPRRALGGNGDSSGENLRRALDLSPTSLSRNPLSFPRQRAHTCQSKICTACAQYLYTAHLGQQHALEKGRLAGLLTS
jgi:hypothetical protein